MVSTEQRLEVPHGLQAQTGELAVLRFFDFGRQHRALGEGVLREDDVAFLSIAPLAWGLPRRGVEDALVHVVVQLIDRDHAVIVTIGCAGLEAINQKVGEQRRVGVADDAIALPGVLGGVGRGKDDASTPRPFERFSGPDADALGGLGAAGEGTAVAAVQHHHLTLRDTAIHSSGNECGLNRGPRQQPALAVAQRQIQMSLFVLHAVPGEIQQQEVVAPPAVVEAGHGLADRCTPLVEECRHLIELTDVRSLQDLREPLNVQIGSTQAAQVRVVVVTVADDESEPGCHCRVLTRE